jgi:hypothetical protein
LAGEPAHFAGDPHPDAQRVAGQIGDRHVLDLDGLQAGAVGAGRNRPLTAWAAAAAIGSSRVIAW